MLVAVKMKRDTWIITGIIVIAILVGAIIISSNMNKSPDYNSNTNTQTSSDSSNSQQYVDNTPSCSDECSFSGKKCIGNDVYSCADTDDDGCNEQWMSSNCADSQSCINAECVTQQQESTKVCKTFHTSGGWFGQMYDLPSGTWWVENSCGFEIDGVLDEANLNAGKRYCSVNVLVDEYFSCESNMCISKSNRFNCADLSSGGLCKDDSGRPECYTSDLQQVVTTN